MAGSKVLNRVGMVIDETGGAYTQLVCDTLISELFNTPEQAGGVDGQSYWWLCEDGTNFMLWEGTLSITSSDVRVNVGTITQSKIAGVSGTTKLTLSGNATLRSPTPADLINIFARGDVAQSFSTTVQRQFRSNIGADFEVNTIQTFRQTLAPTGWTKDTTFNDYAIRIVSGTPSSGGSVNFSTLHGRTTTDAVTLSAANHASHQHTIAGTTMFAISPSGGSLWGSAAVTNDLINLAGQSTVAQGSGTSFSPAIDMRVKYVDMILAQKN